MKLMPQEIEVWYLLPSLRKELTKILVQEYSLKQKEISSLLGITESAISQYLKSKRANQISYTKKEKEIIKETAKKIINDKKNCHKYFLRLSLLMRGSKAMCKFHKKHDQNLPKECELCI